MHKSSFFFRLRIYPYPPTTSTPTPYPAVHTLLLQPLQKTDIFIDHLIVHRVLDIAAFLFGENDRGLCQLLEMMTDRRLRQIDIVIKIDTIKPVVLFFDLAEDF